MRVANLRTLVPQRPADPISRVVLKLLIGLFSFGLEVSGRWLFNSFTFDTGDRLFFGAFGFLSLLSFFDQRVLQFVPSLNIKCN